MSDAVRSSVQRRLGRLDMAHGTRWDRRRGRLTWTAFRSNVAMRDASLSLRVGGRRRLKVTVKAEWWSPSGLSDA